MIGASYLSQLVFREKNCLPIINALICILVYFLAFFVRLFAVIRFESVIHEFDPYFNFRTTKFLVEKGFYVWWNWFDVFSWYPLGRVVGQTLFPGLMLTAFCLYKIVHFFGFLIDIRDICVFTAPIFSGFTSLATYLFVKQSTKCNGASLFAAFFVALSPSYMSRSVAGSYDNEAISIFALIFAFYAYVRALNEGTMFSAVLAALSYFYMAAGWGGYVFITNIVAVHALALLFLQKMTVKQYVTYSVFHIFGTVLCFSIPFINYQALKSSEHVSSHVVFLIVQVAFLPYCLEKFFSSAFIHKLQQGLLILSCIVGTGVAVWLGLTGKTRWTGRSLTLLDPTYASKFVPIVASVAEHQSPVWTSFLFDLHITVLFSSVGLWLCFSRPNETTIFMGLYGVISSYFACIMVRLLLVASPATCALGGLGISYLVSSFMRFPSICDTTHKAVPCKHVTFTPEEQEQPKEQKNHLCMNLFTRSIGILILFVMTFDYLRHCVYVTSIAYSHPSIMQTFKLQNGARFIQDDFREAYYWLRKNTHKDARLMSWWDYGYQSAAMANRSVIVDNNTWNNTHIATVGLAFSSSEEKAYPKLLELDVDYVFVVFGGYCGYSSDDINKFLWMVRIAGTNYPWIQERDYFSASGYYLVGEDASPIFKNSLLYRLSYYRFSESVYQGRDVVRSTSIPPVKPLKYLKEVYTTENWIVRIYEVKRPSATSIQPSSEASLSSAY